VERARPAHTLTARAQWRRHGLPSGAAPSNRPSARGSAFSTASAQRTSSLTESVPGALILTETAALLYWKGPGTVAPPWPPVGRRPLEPPERDAVEPLLAASAQVKHESRQRTYQRNLRERRRGSMVNRLARVVAHHEVRRHEPVAHDLERLRPIGEPARHERVEDEMGSRERVETTRGRARVARSCRQTRPRVAVRPLHAPVMQHGESRLLQASAMVARRKVEIHAPSAVSAPSRPSPSRTSIVETMLNNACIAVFIGERGEASEAREAREREREKGSVSSKATRQRFVA
jgi:hypothetical protein